ncbi:DNA-binding transcriptional regulator of sugar metabolism, DeoR/GlpR family [Raineyella antarctica]|uniref:DNA-binding transcriptional regulator of sugar metabolism, DeoR/GlpR family n=1 Tax=Raineyella antarctica TaxID=1577474 RepID=A0A1G6GEI3_9ACTN|nr:DeoR/GlpR family DNA-binding transcription regulator [Raineyella antarctica]SDB80422.1 DNA-binding transcriptional regulator of sugar metabolism, DeoR/GlpR family [Raineyella antarctica]
MIPLERRRRILSVLEERGTARISELCELLDVSHMTVRRDIGALEELGRVASVPGGVSLPARLVLDQSHAVKEGIRQEEKTAIAQQAASMVGPGELVLLDAGTTTLALARALADRADLTFITNDLAIATYLSEHAASEELYLAAGKVDRANLSTEGAQTAAAIAEYNIDIAFLSTSSFDLRGLSVPTEAKKVVKRAIVENSTRTVLLTDSSKYGKVADLRAARLSELDAVITDSGLPEPARTAIAQQDVPLVLVDVPSPRSAASPSASPQTPTAKVQP